MGKEFQIYKKRQKTNPVEESLQEENVQSTIVLTDLYTSTFPQNEDIFIGSPSYLASQEPLETSQSR